MTEAGGEVVEVRVDTFVPAGGIRGDAGYGVEAGEEWLGGGDLCGPGGVAGRSGGGEEVFGAGARIFRFEGVGGGGLVVLLELKSTGEGFCYLLRRSGEQET